MKIQHILEAVTPEDLETLQLLKLKGFGDYANDIESLMRQGHSIDSADKVLRVHDREEREKGADKKKSKYKMPPGNPQWMLDLKQQAKQSRGKDVDGQFKTGSDGRIFRHDRYYGDGPLSRAINKAKDWAVKNVPGAEEVGDMVDTAKKGLKKGLHGKTLPTLGQFK